MVELDAAQKETVKEFRHALEKHRDFHDTNAKHAVETRWKWISALLAVFGLAVTVAFGLTQVL